MKQLLLTACSAFVLTLSPTLIMAQKNKPKGAGFIDKSNMDLSVKPGDNFYLYANGNWLKNNPVPASQTRWGNFNILAENNEQRLRSLAEDAMKNPTDDMVSGRVGRFFQSYMDSAAIEQAGIKPIQPLLDKINGLKNKKEIMQEMATMRTMGMGSPLFGFYIGQDSKNASEYITRLSQGGTSLPDRDYYLKNDSRSKSIRAAYVSYITDLFQYIGDDAATAAKKAQQILDLETGLATIQWSRVEMRDPEKTYNKYAVSDLKNLTPDWDWNVIFSNLKVSNVDSVVINNPEFFKAADALFVSVPEDIWKSYLQWNVLKSAAPYLTNKFVERNFEFEKVLTGQKEIKPRWQRASRLTDGMLGELIGQLYVKKYFDQNSKDRMLKLVKNVQETFAKRIQRLDWMSDSTKIQALKKLEAIVNKIGFPDKWKTYDGVVIKKDELFNNLRTISQYRYNEMVDKLGKPVDKTEWGMTPPTINAYYNPVNNEIAFPAGILQAPFFDFKADDAMNYGGIAAVIGHELTHGFDDQGRKFAANGNLHNWWTDQDASRFDTLAQKVVKQYNSFVVNDSLHLNGKLTLGENLADLGGLAIAYEAFKNTPEGKSDKKIDGFTPDQRFFLSWAQVWRGNILPESAAQLVLIDPHSPGMYRVNGVVANMDAWYQAFDVKPGDKMYKPESERIKIW